MVSNVSIKPWSAETLKVSLEYYFQRVGLFSMGAFRRDFENFFGNTRFAATPEFLALYESGCGAIRRVTRWPRPTTSRATVRMEGYDVHYKQALTFLPNWARGVKVSSPMAPSQRATAEAADIFSGFIPKTAAWGISLTRPSYSLKVNWNYKSKHRRGARSRAPAFRRELTTLAPKRLFVDIIGEYRLNKNFALFGNIRNLRDTPEDFSRDGPGMPDVAKFRQRDRYGALWIFGVKGTF